MLKQLYIQNYTLIDKLDISFANGFSVITGETGAGKSIMLGAIALLLGQRADSKVIRQGATKCVVEATFGLDNPAAVTLLKDFDEECDVQECIIRRELMASGKSRAFINDSPAPLSVLKQLGELLLDVHSQHKNLLLNQADFQLEVLDTLAHNELQRKEYLLTYQNYRQKQRELQNAIETAQQNQAEEDYLNFQFQQLDEARLEPGEQEELEEEQDMLTHAEDIKQALFECNGLLQNDQQGIIGQLRMVLGTLNSLSDMYPKSREWAERVESTYIELKDIADELEQEEERVEFNPQRLELVNDRLDTLYSLQKKHGKQSVEELITLRDELAAKLECIGNSDEHIAQLKAEVLKLGKELNAKAKVLTEQRKKSAVIVEKEMKARLIPLGMPNVQFVVELNVLKEPTSTGTDKVRFLFSANKGNTPQELSQVASGGEIARVMLSLKALIAGSVQLPTIIFDEIDTGVSGQIAEKMAMIMKEMGDNQRQVISITHLPQIAAKGSVHYKVYKDDNDEITTSHMKQLGEEERVEEIAHMVSGSELTEAALNNARELLK
ncbi:MAG: DNA repair protein RecN [Bacteroidaceae bacterium]|nr:DNA repair protein RecN [Bacteroidaceae bacterium]